MYYAIEYEYGIGWWAYDFFTNEAICCCDSRTECTEKAEEAGYTWIG